MVVVAIIAVLAVIVVPLWTRETRKGKHGSEVQGMLAEIGRTITSHKSDNNGTIIASITECPSTGPDKAGYNFQTICMTSGSPWEALRIQPTQTKLFCSDEVVTGTASDTLTPPSGFLNSQGGVGAEPTLSGSWWYLVAECDENGQGGTNTTFYKSSVDLKTQVQNEGQ